MSDPLARTVLLLGLVVEPVGARPPPETVNALYGPPPVVTNQRCDDLDGLESLALMGNLMERTRTCLKERLADDPERARISRILMNDALGFGERAAYYELARAHLRDIAPDPKVALSLAGALRHGDADEQEEALTWLDFAIANAAHAEDEVTRGRTQHSAYRMRAEVASLRASNPREGEDAEALKARARQTAVDWVGFEGPEGPFRTPALKLCAHVGAECEPSPDTPTPK